MNCQRCGTQFQGSFCPNCGAPAGSPPIGGQPVLGAEDGSRAQKPVTKRWWFWALCVLTLLVLLGTLASLPKDSKEAVENEPAYVAEETQPEETAPGKSSLGKAASVGAADAETSENEGAAPEAPAAAGGMQSAEAVVGETVLLDQNGIRITAVSLENDAWLGPTLNVLVENSTDANVMVQVSESDVNGAMMYAVFSCDVAAGKKANSEITFMQSDLDTAGIETIQTMELLFRVVNPETWNTIFDAEPVTLNTSAAGTFTQAFDQTGQVIMDRDGVKVVARGLDTSDEIWGPQVLFFIENSSGKDVIVQTADSSVNGFMLDPFFSCQVRAGKVAYASASFFTDDLEQNGITDIQTFEFRLHIVDASNWDTLFDSDPVTLEF